MAIGQISRLDASARGMKRFYTGIKCLKGHDSPRYVSTGQCIACLKVAQSKYQTALMFRQLKVWIPLPKDLPYELEDALHAKVYEFGKTLAIEMTAENPMRAEDMPPMSDDLQRMLLDGPTRAIAVERGLLHPGGFKAPRVRAADDKPYLALKTVSWPENETPPSAPMPPIPPPPPPPSAPTAPHAHVASAYPLGASVPAELLDDEPSDDDLLADFERLR